MGEQLSRLNRLVYRAERAFVTVALLVMALVVFLDVLHRAFSGEVSKATLVAIKLMGWIGIDWSSASDRHATGLAVVPWLGFAGFASLGWAAARAATRGRMPHLQAVGVGAFGTAAMYGVIQLLVRVLPNGLVWSQTFALILTLWVGFLGASLATYEHKHLKVEAVVRHVPPHLRNYVAFASACATALFCFALAWVSLRYVIYSYDEYIATSGQGGVFTGLAVPEYIAFSGLPVAFGIMTARFLGHAVLAVQGRLNEGDPLAGLVDDATREAVAAGLAASPRSSDTRAEADRKETDAAAQPSGPNQHGGDP